MLIVNYKLYYKVQTKTIGLGELYFSGWPIQASIVRVQDKPHYLSITVRVFLNIFTDRIFRNNWIVIVSNCNRCILRNRKQILL